MYPQIYTGGENFRLQSFPGGLSKGNPWIMSAKISKMSVVRITRGKYRHKCMSGGKVPGSGMCRTLQLNQYSQKMQVQQNKQSDNYQLTLIESVL